jgi:cell division protein FtsL
VARVAYQRAALPQIDEPLEAPRRAPQRRSRPAARPAHRLLPRHLFVFVILVALLGAGRVTLTFAVVQKSLQTGAAAKIERQLDAENAQLSDEVAALSAISRVRKIALDQLHLVPQTNVRYLHVHAKPAARD